MQGKGKSFLRGRLRWRIRILLTCSPVLTCPGVRSEHQLVKAEAERTAQDSAPRADLFFFSGRLFFPGFRNLSTMRGSGEGPEERRRKVRRLQKSAEAYGVQC